MAFGFGGSLALGLCVAIVIYFRLIRYERVASRHVPGDSSLVLRLDVEHAILYEPFRKHLLPLVNQGRSRTAPNTALPPRIGRIQDATRVELGVDVRELLLAVGATPHDWLLVVGGKFPKSGVVVGLCRMLGEEGVHGVLGADERACVLETGQAFGQASDGALLVASSRSRLDQALPVQSSRERLALSPEGAVAFAASGDWDEGRWPATAVPAALRADIDQVSGIIKLSADMQLQADVQLKRGSASNLKGDLERALERLFLPADAGKSADLAKEKRMTVSVTGPRTLRIVAPVSRGDLDRSAENLATWVRNRVFFASSSAIGPLTPSAPGPGDTRFR